MAPIARITIDLEADGNCHLRSKIAGRFDSSYMPLPDQLLLRIELPKLLAELRAQLALDTPVQAAIKTVAKAPAVDDARGISRHA